MLKEKVQKRNENKKKPSNIRIYIYNIQFIKQFLFVEEELEHVILFP